MAAQLVCAFATGVPASCHSSSIRPLAVQWMTRYPLRVVRTHVTPTLWRLFCAVVGDNAICFASNGSVVGQRTIVSTVLFEGDLKDRLKFVLF
jgi:hypothetical protein